MNDEVEAHKKLWQEVGRQMCDLHIEIHRRYGGLEPDRAVQKLHEPIDDCGPVAVVAAFLVCVKDPQDMVTHLKNLRRYFVHQQ